MSNDETNTTPDGVLTEQRRAYFYRVALAVIALAVIYGAVDADAAPAWVEVAGAVFSVGTATLASVFTSRK